MTTRLDRLWIITGFRGLMVVTMTSDEWVAFSALLRTLGYEVRLDVETEPFDVTAFGSLTRSFLTGPTTVRIDINDKEGNEWHLGNASPEMAREWMAEFVRDEVGK